MAILNDYETSYLVAGGNNQLLLVEAVETNFVSAQKMIDFCRYMGNMWDTEEYTGVIEFCNFMLDDKELAKEFKEQYTDTDQHNHATGLGYFDTEEEKEAFIAARGQGDWYEQYEYAVGDR